MNSFILSATFQSNFHMGSGSGMAGLFDKTCVRDSTGIAYIPASSVKGKIKSYAKRIALTLPQDFISDGGFICSSTHPKYGQEQICKTEEKCIICSLFGSAWTYGKLEFSDLVMSKTNIAILRNTQLSHLFNPIQEEIQNNVGISRLSRTAKPNHLFSTLTVKHISIDKSLGDNIVFKGNVKLRANLSDIEVALLKGAIQSVTHLGGGKAKGLGIVTLEAEGLK